MQATQPMSCPPTLSEEQIAALRTALAGRLIAVCFGSGVDSTAMLVALHAAGLRADVVTFANTGDEKPETIAHITKINAVLDNWGWPRVDVVRKVPLASTGYDTLEGNCLANETLPSLAFGLKSCSIKWKQIPQDQFLKGCAIQLSLANSAKPRWTSDKFGRPYGRGAACGAPGGGRGLEAKLLWSLWRAWGCGDRWPSGIGSTPNDPAAA